MTNIEELALKIEELRSLMQELMKEKDNLIHPEVITASQNLDDLLNEYNELLDKTK
ncbi:Spo0E like sporulation regulatory protein [Clostridiales bacterium oral taxon 876 str. F0540]|nr:Spo0E like sporulation regulatory protein [Clostridiales bacterium oral taxon 876 str. F0540]